jgi:NADH dehydrogenase FAD-containing subunit
MRKHHHHHHHILGATTVDCNFAIYGGGFGGLYAALTLAGSNPNLDIVLVEPSESFVFLPLLYNLTIGTATESYVQ